MAELTPYPFGALVRRMFGELRERGSIFDLPARRFVRGDTEHDCSVRFHGHVASSPLGPAAGPQTQMAQNIVLSWLGGCRILELKTVQILDELHIPRPCIDMRTVGYNAEWSQELKLEQSLEEYVKGSMLVDMLVASGELELARGFDRLVYDMSVGYDLAGIQSERVAAFIEGMMDATTIVDRLRREIPDEFAGLRDTGFRTRLSNTVTLSTFHGCPPDEIERIVDHLLRAHHLHSIIKFNPMLLGAERARELLHEQLGYQDIVVPDSAFTRDARWEQAVGFLERLEQTARGLGLGLGAKFTNTLIVENRTGFLPDSEKEVYLSGPPLHVLAMHLVARFREHFGDRLPISFSAGIDKSNYADAVAVGLAPVTVCTDLLKTGGYGRLAAYHQQLARRMDAVGAKNLDEFTLHAYGLAESALEDVIAGVDPLHPAQAPEPLSDADPRVIDVRHALRDGGDLRLAAGESLYESWVARARCLNTRHYVEQLDSDARYAAAANQRPPRKIGSALELFDCVTCDKCIPVCPNDANFTLDLGPGALPVVKLRRDGQAWVWHEEGELPLAEKHQIANFADFCNECGNCDVFCPEDGGPYIVKPRFFGAQQSWRDDARPDGVFVSRDADGDRAHARFGGDEIRIERRGDQVVYAGQDFELRFEGEDPRGTVDGDGPAEIDLTWYFILDALRRSVLDGPSINYINAMHAVSADGDEAGT